MQRISRNEWARPFGTENLTTLLTRAYEEEFHVTEIIEDPGFQSVARALRNATVYALTAIASLATGVGLAVYGAAFQRSATRGPVGSFPHTRRDNVGFRIARTVR